MVRIRFPPPVSHTNLPVATDIGSPHGSSAGSSHRPSLKAQIRTRRRRISRCARSELDEALPTMLGIRRALYDAIAFHAPQGECHGGLLDTDQAQQLGLGGFPQMRKPNNYRIGRRLPLVWRHESRHCCRAVLRYSAAATLSIARATSVPRSERKAGAVANIAGLGDATEPEAVGYAITAVYIFCCIPFALAALLMFRFVRITLGKPGAVSVAIAN